MEELDVEIMLAVLHMSVASLPERARQDARRGILVLYAALYRKAGLPVPQWVRVGLETCVRPRCIGGEDD